MQIEPTGREPQHVVDVQVEYREVTRVPLTSVLIQPDHIRVPVEDVF